MKLFETIMTERKRPDPVHDKKSRPILVIAENKDDANAKLEQYWGKESYRWTRPNMIADFNPR